MGKDRPIDLGGVPGMLSRANSSVVSVIVVPSCNPWASKAVPTYSTATTCSAA